MFSGEIHEFAYINKNKHPTYLVEKLEISLHSPPQSLGTSDRVWPRSKNLKTPLRRTVISVDSFQAKGKQVDLRLRVSKNNIQNAAINYY